VPSASVRRDAPEKRRDRNHDIDLSAFKPLDLVAGMPRMEDQSNTRRSPGEFGREPGAQRGSGHIGGDKANGTLEIRLDGWIGGYDGGEFSQCGAQWFAQCLRPRRPPQTGRGSTHQQRIIE